MHASTRSFRGFFFTLVSLILLGSRLAADSNQLTGAIFTTDISGTVVNQNLYAVGTGVYLNGGPQNHNGNGLPDGIYYFQITDSSGAKLLSTDDAAARQLVVSGGNVIGAADVAGAHANGAFNPANGTTGVQLWPFLVTPNDGGEYKAWLIRQTANTTIDANDPRVLHFAQSDTKTDNFKIAPAVEPAVTTITLSPTSSTITYGASQTYTVTVTSSSGTPTGTVTITPMSSTTVAGFGPIALVNGTASHVFAGLPAGTYQVNANYTPDSAAFKASSATSVTLIVNPAPLVVSADNQTKTYGTSDPTLTWTYVSGLVGTDTIAVISGALTRAAGENVAGGPYAITQGSLGAGANYKLTVTSGSLTITPANAAISVSPYSIAYDGAAHTATGSATGVKGEVLSGLDLSATTHTNAGSTTDAWTFTDATGNYNNASGSVADAIAKANPAIVVTGYSLTYDAVAHTATGTAKGVLGEALTGLDLSGTTHTNAGSYADAWTFTDTTGNYNNATGTATDVIAKADASVVVTGYSLTYDASAHTATGSAKGVLGEALSGLDLSGTSHTNAGSYTDTWTFTDATGNYNNASGTATDVIAKADATVVVTGYSVTYDASAHTATGSAKGVLGEALNGLDLSGTTHTNAGSYTDTWIFIDTTGNYNNASGTVADGIAKADAVITVKGYTGIYDAVAHGASGTATGVKNENLSSGLILGASFVDVPGGTATWAFSGNLNYNSASGTVAIVITPAPSAVAVIGGSFVYDGKGHGASDLVSGINLSTSVPVVFTDANNAVLSGAPINAGVYTATAVYPGDLNHTGSSGSATITITPAPSTTTVVGGAFVYDGYPHGASDTVTGVNLGTSVAIVYTDANNVVLAGAPTTPGTYTATATYGGDLNHTGSTGSATLTIVGGSITATVFYDVNTNGTFDAGEAALNGWKVTLTGTDNLGHAVNVTAYTTNGSTTFSGLMVGNYTVTQAKSLVGSWVATTATSGSFSLNAQRGMTGTASFGGVSLGAGGALSLGFWSNKNGATVFNARSAANLAALGALNLRTAAGALFVPTTQAAFATFETGATATNMANMLSAQLAAVKMDVVNSPYATYGLNTSGTALICATGANSANAAGFASVNAVVNEAATALGLNGNTTTASATRTYQEALKNILNNVCNNTNFVQATPGSFSF